MPLEFSPETRLQLDVPALDLDFNNTGSQLAVALAGGAGASFRVYAVEQANAIAELQRDVHQASGVAFVGEDTLWGLVQRRGGDYELLQLGLESGDIERIASYDGSEPCGRLVRSPNGQLVAVLGEWTEIWDTTERAVVKGFRSASSAWKLCAAFAPDAPIVYVHGIEGGAIDIYDLSTNEQVGRLPAPAPFGAHLSVSPSGRYLVAVGWGVEGVFIHDMETGKQVFPERFNESSWTSLYEVTTGDILVGWPTRQAVATHLQEYQPVAGPERGVIDQVVIASAFETPIVAFSSKDGSIVWLELSE